MHQIARRAILQSALFALVATIAVLAGPSVAAAANPPNSYSIVLSPSTVQGGTTATVTAKITNESRLPLLSAAALVWPAPLQVLSASLPKPWPQPSISTCRVGAVMKPCVRVHLLALLSGQSLTVTMSVMSPPSCSSVIGTWTGAVHLLDDFSGPPITIPGYQTLDTATSKLTTQVNDSCHLAFATEPNNVIVGQHITNSSYDQTGGPVTVDILDLNNTLVTTSTASVAAALATNPGSANLGGTTTQTAVGGIATFSDLTVDKSGTGDTLSASSATMVSGTSTPFTAEGAGASCASGSCTTSVSTPNGSDAGVTATGGSTGTLVESVNQPGEPSLSCTGYTSIDPNTYDFFTTTAGFGKFVTLTLANITGLPLDTGDDDKVADFDGDYDDILPSQQICFQASVPFTAVSPPFTAGTPDGTQGPAVQSTIGGMTVYTGLLPDCSSVDASQDPCHQRNLDGITTGEAGDTIILHASIPAAGGDPRMN